MKLIEKIRYQVAIRAVFNALNIPEGALGFHCPFHNDKTGTILLKETENRFSCSVCGASGTAVDVVKKVKSLDTDSAVAWLAKRFDIEADSSAHADLLSSWKSDHEAAMPTLSRTMGKAQNREISEKDMEIFTAIYTHGKTGQAASMFLEHRGFTPEQIDAAGFRIVEKPRILLVELTERFTKDELDAAGVLDENREFIFQKHNLLIPFHNETQLRFLAGWDMGAGHRAIIFPRRKNCPLWLSPETKNRSPLFIVEDLAGALTFYRAGFPALAVPGKVTNDILSFISGKQVSVCGEKSERGNRFNREVIKLLTENGFDFQIRETAPCFDSFLEYIAAKRR
ncbi:MAG: hypothetical protein GXO69_06620 [Acidobacteria bacterium]|nr:hypothetical protein [Acidobacteriota bacterium]